MISARITSIEQPMYENIPDHLMFSLKSPLQTVLSKYSYTTLSHYSNGTTHCANDSLARPLHSVRKIKKIKCEAPAGELLGQKNQNSESMEINSHLKNNTGPAISCIVVLVEDVAVFGRSDFLFTSTENIIIFKTELKPLII